MSQIHIVLRRINPALKIDLVQVGRFDGNQFEPLPFSAIEKSSFACFLKSSSISDSPYINHSDITDLIAACWDYSCFNVEFFDNTIILMFDLNLDDDESTTKEEGEGD